MVFQYGNIAKNEISRNINTVFPDFGQQEVLAVMSPHDDDAILGAGYAILAAQQADAEVYIVIFCRGDAGYSTLAEKIQSSRFAKRKPMPVIFVWESRQIIFCG